MDLDTKAFISSEDLIKLESCLLYFYTMFALPSEKIQVLAKCPRHVRAPVLPPAIRLTGGLVTG